METEMPGIPWEISSLSNPGENNQLLAPKCVCLSYMHCPCVLYTMADKGKVIFNLQ